MAKRVLVVAGREGVAPALQLQIELWGRILDFTLAASGNEALWEVRGSPYDLVLAPWQLPEMNGIEFAEVVQALSPAAKVVLIGVPITPALRSQAKALDIYALLAESSPQEVAVLISRALEIALPRRRPTPTPAPQVEPEPAPAPLPTHPKPAPPKPQPAVEKTSTVETEPTPAAKPAAPPAKEPTPPLPVQVTLSTAQQAAVRRALQDLLISIGPQVAVLLNAGGEILVAEGSPGSLNMEGLCARAVATMVGSDDVAEFLGDEHIFGLGLLVGSRYDIYTFTVTDTTVLLLVFDKTILEGKLGSVWLYTRKLVEELQDRLA
ncbi:MAG: hypothetical protein JXA37_07995 [Chloroflexia bacterium]|nr:hypothetical protein [Chloroflexia bacterium]